MANGQFTADISRWTAKTKGEIDIVLRKIVLEILRRLILKSPVRTGRFRGSWFASYEEGGAFTETEGSGARQPREGHRRHTPAEALTADIRGADEVLSEEGAVITAWDPAVHTSIWISNNLPYALRLEYGWSKQAPEGMVRITLLEMESYAPDAEAA